MRIALLGDIHLFRVGVWPWRLLSKRVLGQMNLWMNRRRRFNVDLIDQLVAKVAGENPDVLLCTGDLTTTSLEAEFESVVKRFGPLFAKQPTYIVPGNHDRYTFGSARGRVLERYLGEYVSASWPHHHVLDEGLELIGLDASKPTWFYAGNALPDEQLERLGELLAGMAEGSRAIVMLHYPIGTPTGYERESKNHGLQNPDDLIGVLRDSGREILYLNGHVHVPWCWRLDEAPNVVAVNAGSPLYKGHGYAAGQGYWVIETGADASAVTSSGEPRGWSWPVLRHVHPLEGGGWTETEVKVPGEAGGVAEMGGG